MKGVFTALITPFTDENSLDEDGLRLLIARQIQANVDGIVILGTTGEAPTLETHEQERMIEIARNDCTGKTSLIIGTGSYSTKNTIWQTQAAQDAGADAVLIVTPYYNKPTQEGLYQHFKEIAKVCKIPIIVYNIAGRTAQNLQTDTLKRLMDIPSIIGIKEASGNISQINDVIGMSKEFRPEFSVLSGDDALTLPLMALGGNGIISVVSNLLPFEVKNLVEAINSGDFVKAREIHFGLMPYVKLAFVETNPIPIKAMMEMADLPAGKCRLPLCGPNEENLAKLRALLEHALTISHS